MFLGRLQAQKLDEMLRHRGTAIDKVLSFEVPDSVLVRPYTLYPILTPVI